MSLTAYWGQQRMSLTSYSGHPIIFILVLISISHYTQKIEQILTELSVILCYIKYKFKGTNSVRIPPRHHLYFQPYCSPMYVWCHPPSRIMCFFHECFVRSIQDSKIREARKFVSSGCTALAVVFFMGKLYVANAGDSRYYVRIEIKLHLASVSLLSQMYVLVLTKKCQINQIFRCVSLIMLCNILKIN